MSKELQLVSESLKSLILLSSFTRWPATPTYPCTALTQRGLSSQCLEWIHNWILSKWIFWLRKLISDIRICELISIMREVRKDPLLKGEVKKWQLRRLQLTVSVKRACNPQRMNHIVTIWSLVHLNSAELHWRMQSSFLCPLWENVLLCIHTYCSISLSTSTFI